MKYKDYKKKYSQLVELERREEMDRHKNEIKKLSARERQDKGRALLHMKGKSQGKGLGGSYIVKFTKGEKLPDNEISVGDLVMISKNEPLNPDNPTGTVIKKTNYSISVAFRNKPIGFVYGKNLRIDLYVNDITFQRMLDALDSFKENSLKDVVMGISSPHFSQISSLKIENDSLDSSQREAVKKSLEADDLFLVHGPPGTGKTTTLIEIIEQHVKRDFKVLATADSNVATDNIVDFLIERGLNAVRVGHPARVTKSLRKHTLDFIVEKKSKYKKAQNLRDKADEIKDKQEEYDFPSGKNRRGLSNKAIKSLAKKGGGSRGIHPKKIKSMAKWIKLQDKRSDLIEKSMELEDQAVDSILKNADVVCTTNSTAGSELIKDKNFDVVAIDEATQATEPSCLISMDHTSKAVMAGDHKQLPPTILNQEAKEKGLEETIFERMLEVHGSEIKSMLEIQYRMNTDIMNFPSCHFYNGELKAAPSVKNHKLAVDASSDDIASKVSDAKFPITFVDTPFDERTRAGSTSKENPQEASLVEKIVRKLISLGVAPKGIGVISPYDDQVDLLNKKMKIPNLEIKTVDGFQGREKEVIILSFVRSNNRGELGFLTDLRRLNVSITRARKKLIMVGNSDTLENNRTYKELIDYVKEDGLYLKE